MVPRITLLTGANAHVILFATSAASPTRGLILFSRDAPHLTLTSLHCPTGFLYVIVSSAASYCLSLQKEVVAHTPSLSFSGVEIHSGNSSLG